MRGWKQRILKLGTAALAIGWLLNQAHASPQPNNAPIISETQGAIITTIMDVASGHVIGRILNPGNDNALTNNYIWLGWQMMGECSQATNWENKVSDALGPCAPNLADPRFGIGFQRATGLSQSDCTFRSRNAASAIEGTIVPGLLAVAGYTPYNGQYPGGVCDLGGNYTFSGWFMNEFLLYVGGLSAQTCIWMTAQCEGPSYAEPLCSCGPYGR